MKNPLRNVHFHFRAPTSVFLAGGWLGMVSDHAWHVFGMVGPASGWIGLVIFSVLSAILMCATAAIVRLIP